MASLALLITIIFLCVLIIGPISYLLSLFSWMPKIIKWLLALCCILIGGWSLFMPLPLFRILGLIDLAIGLKIIADISEKKTGA